MLRSLIALRCWLAADRTGLKRTFLRAAAAALALSGQGLSFAQYSTAQVERPLNLDEWGENDAVPEGPRPAIGPAAPADDSIHPPGLETDFGWHAEPFPSQHNHELDAFHATWSFKSFWPEAFCTDCISWLGLRHSRTHGRHVGLGAPLVGTSWLNRPYYVGAELGELWIMRSQDDHVNRDHDVIGGIFFGCDWDHYWGSDLRIDWATPELKNSTQPDADRSDSLFTWSLNSLYYPWGDSKFRPYWRLGVGSTHFDFPTDAGTRRDEWLLTLPVGIGIKIPIRHWLALRTEFTDQFSIGAHGLPTQHNLTLTAGLECRFGVQPKSYWPWNPDRHIW